MKRYAEITTKMPRELLLLQGQGCHWGRCTFCDYHSDISDDPYSLNKDVLSQVTGRFGVLDIINSGSCLELDEATLQLITAIACSKQIHTIWFEAHWHYRNQLAAFASRFANCVSSVKFRTGIESFNPRLRQRWQKGIPATVTPEVVSTYFQGICLLVGLVGQTAEDISADLQLAERYFDYYSVNVFIENSTAEKRDSALIDWFRDTWSDRLKHNPKAELLVNNTDLGVG